LKNRILFICSEFPPGPGGIGHHAWFLTKELSKLENTVIEVLAPADYADELEVLNFDNQQNFIVHRFKRMGWLTYLARGGKVINLLFKHEYSHFWASGKFSLWLVWLQKAFLPQSKTLCILHGSEVNLGNRYLRFFTHQSIFQFQIIVSVSRFTQSLLPNWILEDHKSLIVIPNGLDVTDFTLSNSVELQGYPVLLTVGHVSPRKGQHRLIKALPELIKMYPDVVYHIVGRPIDQIKLESLASELGVDEHIVFHGAVKNHSALWDYYKAADIFVLLSENQPNGDVEGFGIVALEANAVGTPVIGTKYCGVEEAVLNEKSGVLVDGNSVEDIVNAIYYCMDSREGLKVSSQHWAKTHDWEIIGKRFLELI
jgi:phosphatidylinositol alpha-1,6-mannosyltransferase